MYLIREIFLTCKTNNLCLAFNHVKESVSSKKKKKKKKVNCANCGDFQLSKTCVSKNVLKLSKSSNTYICNWDILSEILPSVITIDQNEDFILCMFSNKFVINHVNNEIHSM